MAQILASAPAVVEIEGDDGWAAACLAVSGRSPVAGARCDVQRIERTLRRLGLPRLGRALPAAVLAADLTLHGDAEPGCEPLEPVSGDLVSILVCTYNRADLVVQAIASARTQAWPCEVVVVDDGSTDDTADVLSRIDGIRVFRQENLGKSAALNRAIAEARGAAFLVLDDDDLLLPGTVRVLAHALAQHPELAAVYGDTILFEHADPLRRRWLPATGVPGARALQHALTCMPASAGATLVRREAQAAAGAYDTALTHLEDVDMFQRLARVGPIEAVPVPLHLHRRHEGPRGNAAAPIPVTAPRAFQEAVLAEVAPRFKARWKEFSPTATRAEGHAWALGLCHRGLAAEGLREARRWPPPYTPTEQFVRSQLGLIAPQVNATEAVVIVDDGDVGALEETLHRHADGRSIWVDLEVPRDPIDTIRVHWQGQYAARERLHRWVNHHGPVHLRLSSAPEWAPPPLRGVADLPDFSGPDALVAIAAALDWPFPVRTRGVNLRVAHPVARLMIHARLALRKGQPRYALHRLTQIVKLAPEWRLGWQVAGEVFDVLGYANEAASCRHQAMNCRVAAA